jgi:ABC-type Fe3+ transport system permease subunit
LLVTRTAHPGRTFLKALFTLPAALPPFILGMGCFNPAGVRSRFSCAPGCD